MVRLINQVDLVVVHSAIKTNAGSIEVGASYAGHHWPMIGATNNWTDTACGWQVFTDMKARVAADVVTAAVTAAVTWPSFACAGSAVPWCFLFFLFLGVLPTAAGSAYGCQWQCLRCAMDLWRRQLSARRVLVYFK